MPSPPFQPLTTLSRELWLIAYEWHEPKFESHPADRIIAGLLRECEAQVQEADSLRQRLETWIEIANGCGQEIESLKAQLAQAQQERDEAREFGTRKRL